MQWILRLLAVACAILACSCIDAREEVWFDSGGGGRADIQYAFPAGLPGADPDSIRSMISDFFARNADKFSSSRHQVHQRDGRIEIAIQAEFRSAMELVRLELSDRRIPKPVKHFIGDFAVKQEGREVSLRRTIDAGKSMPGWRFMPAARFEGRKLVQIVHLPEPALSSNATRINDGARTLVWETPVSQALRGPIEMRFAARFPIPWKSLIGTAAALTAGLAVLIRYRRRRKRV